MRAHAGPRSRLLAAAVAAVSLAAVVPSRPASAATPPIGATAWSRTDLGGVHKSSPNLADVNGDGVPDVLVGNMAGWVHVRDGRTGASLPGWPQPASVTGGAPSAVESSPTVHDLDRDGRPEVVVGVGSDQNLSQPGGIVVFRRDGSVRCRRSFGPGHQVMSTPAAGDVDGDGYADLVFGAFDLRIHALDRSCNEVSGFPFFHDDTIFSSPVLSDVDADGRMEIFVGGDSTPGGSEDWRGGVFRALDWDGGRVVERWKQRVRDTFFSSPAIGDLNGDGRLELVTGTGDFYTQTTGAPDSVADGRRVWAFHVNDGSWVPGWPVSMDASTWGSPSIGDLDGDGRAREVVLGARNGRVFAFRGSGALLWATPPGKFGDQVNSSAALADLTGDGAEDVVVNTRAGTVLLGGKSGAHLGTVQGGVDNSPALAKFGSAGWRLVTGSGGFLQAVNVRTPSKTPAWPLWRRNPRHLGALPAMQNRCGPDVNPTPTPTSTSAKGYWVLGGDGGVFSFGSTKFYGSLPSIGVSARAASLASTPTGLGYWMPTGDGRVYPFGDAKHYGSMAGRPLAQPIRRLVPTPSGKGYWLLGGDGGVFTFGDAKFHGSTGAMRLDAPVISMEPTPTGKGYWLLGADGGIFSFGDARFMGSTPGVGVKTIVLSMAVRPQGDGYWLLGIDGGVFSFGKARFEGSVPGTGACSPPLAVQLRSTGTGEGYYLLATTGKVFSFGDAKGYGSTPPLSGARAAQDLAVRR